MVSPYPGSTCNIELCCKTRVEWALREQLWLREREACTIEIEPSTPVTTDVPELAALHQESHDKRKTPALALL